MVVAGKLRKDLAGAMTHTYHPVQGIVKLEYIYMFSLLRWLLTNK